jgi:hypothetical protein
MSGTAAYPTYKNAAWVTAMRLKLPPIAIQCVLSTNSHAAPIGASTCQRQDHPLPKPPPPHRFGTIVRCSVSQ